MRTERVLIMGAAGRDFHDFNVVYRDDPSVEVVAFTATQIPGIADRRYPTELAGERYPAGIPIRPEAELEALIAEHDVNTVVFAYSDVSHEQVMHAASRVLAAGADFKLLGPDATMLPSTRPVVAVCAVRTGSGKSQTSRYVAKALEAQGLKVAVVRHPMPYGDLVAQRCQRYETYADLDRHQTTIEERASTICARGFTSAMAARTWASASGVAESIVLITTMSAMRRLASPGWYLSSWPGRSGSATTIIRSGV